MKKLLVLSVLIGFQGSQGMGMFRSDDESSSNCQGTLQNYSVSSLDQKKFSRLKSCDATSSIQNKNSRPPMVPSLYQDEYSKPPMASMSYQNEYSRPPIAPSLYQDEYSKPPMATMSYQSEYSRPPMAPSLYQDGFGSSSISAQTSKGKSSQPIYIVTPSASGYFSSDEHIEPHSFSSGEKIDVPIDFRRRNSTQVGSAEPQNADANLFREKLEFYDNFPKEVFHFSEINRDGWDKKPEDFYVTILLGRHVGDKANMNKTAHTSSGHSEINLETVGIDKALSLMTLGYLFKFDAIAAGTSARHDTTARLISSFSPEQQEYSLMKEFNEQKLGHLGGKHEKEILRNPEFIRMFTDLNYKMKKNDMEEDEDCETGNEVIRRFTSGIDKMIDSVRHSRERYVETYQSDFDSVEARQDYLNKNMLLYICTSRCTLNWMIKYFTGNMQLPLQLKTIQNCNLFCVNYYPGIGSFNMLLNNEDMPFCLTPLHFSQFALKSPIFSPFIQTFCQKVSRIIEKQDKRQDKRQKLMNQSNSEKLLRTVYLKMLSQSFSYQPEPKRKVRQRAKSG